MLDGTFRTDAVLMLMSGQPLWTLGLRQCNARRHVLCIRERERSSAMDCAFLLF